MDKLIANQSQTFHYLIMLVEILDNFLDISDTWCMNPTEKDSYKGFKHYDKTNFSNLSFLAKL